MKNVRQNFKSIATLGNNLTCSYFAAERYCKKSFIEMFESFEEAAKAVKDEQIEALFVPGAYPNIRFFIMDDSLVVKETAIIQIPALVLAGPFEKKPENIEKIFLHPAPERLLNEVETQYSERIFVNSNPNACVEVLAHKENSIAITNDNCARFYGLNIYKVLRPGILMPFVIFVHV